MDRRFILSRQETVQIFHKMVNRGIFSVQYHILKSVAENDAKDAAHSWKQSSFNVAKTNHHPTKLNDQYAALRCKTSADLGFWCTWRSFAAADELANGLFVLQQRVDLCCSTDCVTNPRCASQEWPDTAAALACGKEFVRRSFVIIFRHACFHYFQTQKNLREQRAWMCCDSRKTRIWWELRETNTSQ